MLAGPVGRTALPSRLISGGDESRRRRRGLNWARPVLAFATRAPIGGRQIGQLKHLGRPARARPLLLPMVAGPAEVVGSPRH